MSSDRQDKIDSLASDLDDLKATTEELEVEPAPDRDHDNLRVIKSALEEATVAVDDLVDPRDDD
jgi:hypothetical protein